LLTKNFKILRILLAELRREVVPRRRVSKHGSRSIWYSGYGRLYSKKKQLILMGCIYSEV
jgi:hypothetical protein